MSGECFSFSTNFGSANISSFQSGAITTIMGWLQNGREIKVSIERKNSDNTYIGILSSIALPHIILENGKRYTIPP